MRKVPQLRELLLKREISITTLSLVAGELTPEDTDEVMLTIRGKSRSDVEEWLAGRRPKAVIPRELIRPIQVRPVMKVAGIELHVIFRRGCEMRCWFGIISSAVFAGRVSHRLVLSERFLPSSGKRIFSSICHRRALNVICAERLKVFELPRFQERLCQ